MTLTRHQFKEHFVNLYETPEVILGFTELGFPDTDLPLLFPIHCKRVLHLNQIHGNKVFFSDTIATGQEPDGDGIILTEKRTMAVIQTADCTPLFFWDNEGVFSGVLHVGWQGLWKGITLTALDMINQWQPRIKPHELNYLLGPAIEPHCYEVGQDLVEKFSRQNYSPSIFSPISGKPGKYWMDVKLGISLSLKERGVSLDSIIDCDLCTFCERERFPSYRRYRDSGERIYNFILIK